VPLLSFYDTALGLIGSAGIGFAAKGLGRIVRVFKQLRRSDLTVSSVGWLG